MRLALPVRWELMRFRLSQCPNHQGSVTSAVRAGRPTELNRPGIMIILGLTSLTVSLTELKPYTHLQVVPHLTTYHQVCRSSLVERWKRR